MSGIVITGRQIAGACHDGRKIGLAKAGSVLLPALSDNLIVNPGFENGLTGWTYTGVPTIQTRENSSYITEPHGGASWVIIGNEGSYLQSSFFRVEPGGTYEIGLWKAEAWEIRRHTVSMAYPDGTVEDILHLPGCDHNDLYKWQRFSTTWTAGNITSAALRITNTAYGYGRFDDISVRQII